MQIMTSKIMGTLASGGELGKLIADHQQPWLPRPTIIKMCISADRISPMRIALAKFNALLMPIQEWRCTKPSGVAR